MRLSRRAPCITRRPRKGVQMISGAFPEGRSHLKKLINTGFQMRLTHHISIGILTNAAISGSGLKPYFPV